MQKYIDDKLMDTRHTLIGRLDQSMMTLTEKIEAGDQRIMDVERSQEHRIRDVERVLDRFSGGSGNKS